MTVPPPARIARRSRDLLALLRQLSRLSPDERKGLIDLSRWAGEENVRARRVGAIAETAIVSPLASFRFVERVEVGDRAAIGPYCCIWGGWSRTWARVGDRALLSPGVVLVAGNHRIDGTGPIRDNGFDELDVEVGEDAWVGAHSVIVGCRVGRGAVVGANSVVLEDVPDFAIAVGVPARVVGTRADD